MFSFCDSMITYAMLNAFWYLTYVQNKTAAIKDQLLKDFLPDDVCPLGAQLVSETSGKIYRFGSIDDNSSDEVVGAASKSLYLFLYTTLILYPGFLLAGWGLDSAHLRGWFNNWESEFIQLTSYSANSRPYNCHSVPRFGTFLLAYLPSIFCHAHSNCRIG